VEKIRLRTPLTLTNIPYVLKIAQIIFLGFYSKPVLLAGFKQFTAVF